MSSSSFEENVRKQQLDYAARLSEYNHKGVCGVAEHSDSTRALASKIKRLSTMFRRAKHVVVHTGAGISTSAGIPDFRGPDGVWTLEKAAEKAANTEKRRQKRKRTEKDAPDKSKQAKNEQGIIEQPTEPPPVSWDQAQPTVTHMCLMALHNAGKLQYTVTLLCLLFCICSCCA